MKLKPIGNSQGEIAGYGFYCQACDEMHQFIIKNDAGKPIWTFDGNLEVPTFRPSLKYTWQIKPNKPECCHLNLTAGKVFYHNDCTHALRGKTIDLPEIPAKYFPPKL